MQVILRQDVPGTGKRGDILTVKDGYARNYLIPRGLAVPLTESTLKERAGFLAAQEEKQSRLLALAKEAAAKLDGKTLTFRAKVGQGRMFGSVTAQDIAQKIWAVYKVQVDRRKVLLETNLKDLGVHQVPIQLHPQVRATINVEIVPEVDK